MSTPVIWRRLELNNSVYWLSIWTDGSVYRFQSLGARAVGHGKSIIECIGEARRQLTQKRTTRIDAVRSLNAPNR